MLYLSHLPHHEPGEKVILSLRRHWFILAKIVAIFVLLSIIPIIVRGLLMQEVPDIFIDSRWNPAMSLLISAYYLYIWVLWYQRFLDYYLDIWIVTDRRIINIEQNDLFHRVISENRLNRIQDVSSVQKGLLPTFLDYGEVSIQTAGEQPKFHFEQVPRPHRVAQQINKLVKYNKALKVGRL